MREVDLGNGAALIVSADMHEEMIQREVARAMGQRADHPITFAPFSGGAHAFDRTTPDRHSIMRELVKADSASATRAIAERMMSIALHAFMKTPDDERIPQPDSRLEDILETPNPILSMDQLIYFTAWTLVPAGEAFWQIIPDVAGIPTQLWPIPYESVEIRQTRENPIDHFEVRDGSGVTRRLAPEEVVHFWFPDPAHPMRGLGRLGPQATRWNAARSQEQRFDSFYKNDGTSKLGLEGQTAEAVPPTGVDLDVWNTMMRNRYHRIHGISQGIPLFAPPGYKFKEFQEPDFGGEMELRKQLSADLFKAYGVPEAILGVVTDVNRASTEGVRFIFDLNTIAPLMNLIVNALNRQLAPLFDATLEVQHDKFVMDDKVFELAREEADLRGKVRTVNEVRATRPDLEPVDYGELPVGTIAETPYTGEDAFAFGDERAEDLEGTPRSDAQGGPAVRASSPPSPSSGSGVRGYFAPAAQWLRNVAVEKQFGRKTNKAVSLILKIQNRDVSRKLTNASRALADVNMADLFNPNDPRWVREWARKLGPTWREIFLEAGIDTWEGLGLASPFELTQTMVDQIAGNLAELSRLTGESTWTSLDTILREGIAEGASPSSVAARIRNDTFSAKRAKAIARTEIGKANQQGQLVGMETSQVVREKEWNTSQDGRVRDSHLIDGQTVLLADEFTLNSGSRAQHPLDPSLPAADLVNCRCFMTPVIGVEGI